MFSRQGKCVVRARAILNLTDRRIEKQAAGVMLYSRRLVVPIFVVVSMLLLPGMLLADVTGSISGVVHDPSQAVVKGARVTITNTQTNLSQSMLSGDDGSYRFLALPVGTYRLNASMTGFQQFNTTDIVLKVNDELRFD